MFFARNLFESKYYGFDLALWFLERKNSVQSRLAIEKNNSKLLERKQMHSFQCCQFLKQKTTVWKVWIFWEQKTFDLINSKLSSMEC